MDHCRPRETSDIASNLELVKWKSKKQALPKAIVAPRWESESFTMSSCDNSEITFWFCTLMRSIFPDECTKAKENCKICNEIKERINTVCYGAFIDGMCLELHMKHMVGSHGQYKTEVDVCVKTPGKSDDLLILAHYNKGGVYYRVFPYREGRLFIILMCIFYDSYTSKLTLKLT